jgi:hypothetical protein
VTVKRGNNCKQIMVSTNAFCCLKIENGPPKETQVGLSEGFSFAYQNGRHYLSVCEKYYDID